eukprot:1146073-Rhodomonas_salina.2
MASSRSVANRPGVRTGIAEHTAEESVRDLAGLLDLSVQLRRRGLFRKSRVRQGKTRQRGGERDGQENRPGRTCRSSPAQLV